MYTLGRRFIKTGVGFLFAGLILGAVMLVRRELFGVWPHPHLVSAHAHAVLVGFVMFMILGVALWLFPRAEKTDERYRPERIEAGYTWIHAATKVYDELPFWPLPLIIISGSVLYTWLFVRSGGSALGICI